MKYYFYLILSVCCFVAGLFSCQNKEDNEFIVPISINAPSPPYAISDILSLKGYTYLNNDARSPIRGINRLLFTPGKIILLDRETDFENIYVFDENTGEFLNAIGKQSEAAEDGYYGVMDISLDDNSNICALSAGKQSFITYDLSGKYISSTPNGMYGDRLVSLPNKSGHVVYNEMSANEVSGDYYLLFFDNEGNLKKRVSGYPKTCNGQSYEFTGFLTSLKSNIWFSPPFCDTIFVLDRGNIVPRYTLDFGRQPIPSSAINKNASGWDFDKSPYLCEKFACIDDMIVFEFMENSKVNLGCYDEAQHQFYKFCNSSKDCLSDLIQAGDIYPKDNNSFALVIRPARIQYLMKNHLLDEDGLKKNYPGLLSAIQSNYQTDKYLILYLGKSGVN